MTEEHKFPAGERVEDLDLSGARVHGLNLEGARVTEAYLYGAEISGDIEGLRLNRVDVEPAGHGVSFGGRYRRGPSKGCAG